MSWPRRWPALGMALLLGCESADERCGRIDRERLYHDIDQGRHERLSEMIAEQIGYGTTWEQASKIVYAQDAELMRRHLDSTWRAKGEDPLEIRRIVGDTDISTDSLKPEVSPPPRPSDLAWYGEHCWEGKPR